MKTAFIIIGLIFILSQLVYSNIKDAKVECPNIECCIPVVGNEYPPCAIDRDFFCVREYYEVCPSNIADLVMIRITLANFAACQHGGQSYDDCYFITNGENCINSPEFQLMLQQAQMLMMHNSNCENIDIQGNGN